MGKKLIIFDADGTLWDSEKDVFLSFNHILKEKSGIEVNYQQFKELAGLSLEMMFEKTLPEDKKNIYNDCAMAYRKYYIEEKHCLDTTELFKGVRETLEQLKRDGVFIAIASGKVQKAVDDMVEFFKLDGFEFTLGIGKSQFKNKPDPGVINYLMSELNVSKEETIMVGDTAADILAGQNAGVDTVAVTYGYDKLENITCLNPTYIIDDFSKLLEIIKK